MERIYLDHAATTPLHPAVLEAMMPHLTHAYGNASSIHGFGRQARLAVDRARDAIAKQLACSSGELLFTSGGTESDNLAILGVIRAWKQARVAQAGGADVRPHVITSRIEHHAVLHACALAERELDCDLTYVDVDDAGRVNLDQLRAAIRPGETCLVTVMWGNNEVGTIQPIAEIAAIAHEAGALFHTDGVQALGHMAFTLNALPIDLASFSAHKINGPQGVGALYVKQGTLLAPMLVGGSQEKKRRAGTENVAAIVGFAKAVELAVAEPVTSDLRDFFLAGLKSQFTGDTFTVNTPLDDALPHILNVSFPGIATETMLMNLDLQGVAAASGSACTSGSLEVSHVLEAMGLDEARTASAIRFSFGRDNNRENVTIALQVIKSIVTRLHSKL
jgi:cysteine desulfurase